MPCKDDVKYAILNTAFSELTDGRNTFTRINDDTIQINNVANNANTKSHSREQDRAIARNLVDRVKRSFNGHVTGEINELSPYDPLTITLHPSQRYIDHEYNRLNDNIKNYNPVEYELKSVDILNSAKADEIFKKGDKNGWSLDKILDELQIPKEQQQLIKDFDTRNREQILVNLAAKYSYAVEINTAKQALPLGGSISEVSQDEDGNPYFTYNGNNYSTEKGYNLNNYWKDSEKITQQEFEKAMSNLTKLDERPTQHYSNLTVPGGINYTENEIATPAITPSIKGHAQFATDNGIGWFRSDETATEPSHQLTSFVDHQGNTYNRTLKSFDGGSEWVNTKNGVKISSDEFSKTYANRNLTKTRRILEVQSDLFQKGRDKEELIKPYDKSEDWQSIYQKEKKDLFESRQNGYITGAEYRTELARIEENANKKAGSSENQFLQLLNKDNNWVTFFIKSIIQDSAKKGYENVLFPKGDTASKIEGHATLEEFKKQKEDRVKVLEKRKTKELEIIHLKYEAFKEAEKNKELFPSSKVFYTEDKYERLATLRNEYSNFDEKNITLEIDFEITQLKHELERVETEGFGALKPIFKFYEENVTNILKKIGNTEKFTDEHGNTWSKLNITKENRILLEPKIEDNLPREQVRDMVNANTGINSDYQIKNFEPRDNDDNVIAGVYEGALNFKKDQMANYIRRLNIIKDLKRDSGVSVEQLNKYNTEERKLKETIWGNGLTGIHEVKGLKQEIDEISSKPEAFIKSVGYYVEKDLDRLSKLVKSPDLEDLNEADRLIKFYDLAGTFDGTKENPFFTEDDMFLRDENGKLTAEYALPTSVMDQYKAWRDKAIGQRRLVDAGHEQVTVDTVNNDVLVQATYGKNPGFAFDGLTYKNTGLKDTDWISMWTMDSTHGIASDNGLLPQVSMSVLRNSIEHKEAWSRQHSKEVEEMLPHVTKELIKMGHDFRGSGILGIKGATFNLFKQISKEGNESHNLIQRYTKEQQDEQSRALDTFQNDFDKARDLQDLESKKAAINRAFDKLKRFKRENLIILDSNKLEDVDYKKKMVSLLGEKGYEEQVKEQKYQLNRYESDRENIIQTILTREGKGSYEELDEQGKNAIKQWEVRHNPEKGIEDYNSVSGIFFGNTKDNNFMDYNTFIPRKFVPIIKADINKNEYNITDSDKLTDNYDKNFALIESNPVLSAFYDKVKEFCEVVHENMPYDLQESTSTYTLPSLMKSSSEIINDKNTGVLSAIFAPFRQIMERIRLSFGVVKQGDISNAIKDPITGKPNYKVNDTFLRNNSVAIRNRMLVEQAKFLQAYNSTLVEKQKIKDIKRFSLLNLNKFNPQALLLLSDYLHANISLADAQNGNIQAIKNKLDGSDTVEIGRLIADFSVHSIVQSQSFDLPKLMRYFGDLTMAYAARQEALPILSIMKKHYDSILAPKTNNVGIAIRNSSDNKYVNVGIRTRAFKQFDEAFERVVLGNRDVKHEQPFGEENKNGKIPLIGKTIYSKEERKEYDDLTKLIKNEPDDTKRKQLIKLQEGLGRTRVASAIYDNMLNWIRTLRLGYNVSSMITNYAEGIVSNVILGSSNEFFDPKELLWGYNANKHSFIKNATFGFLETPLAKKVRGFVDKFNVVIDNKNELQRSSYTSFSSRMATMFGPFEGNSRVEYMNQTPLMIAILRTMKLKDKDGNESSVWDAFDDNINLKPEFRTQENIENWEQNGPQRKVFSQKLNAVITLGHGNYDTLRGMLIKANPIGKTGMMFKTWLPEQIFWRFAKKQDMIALGKVGFKGRYWSYGGGSGLVHGAAVGAVTFGPMGAIIGGGLGLGAGLIFGTNTGGGIVGLIKETILTTKQLILKAIGMPINLLAGRQIIGDNIGKNAFESWVGKGKFTKQDEYNMKANMADLSIQLALLAMIMAVKAMFWDDNDKPEDPERKAHNILVNKLMQTSSQLAMYVNPVDTYHSTVGSIAAVQYLTDIGKEIDKVQNWANGNDVLTSGINSGKSGLGIQTRKILLPGLFKDPMLGFKSMSQTIYPQDSPWGKYFHSTAYYDKQELKQNRAELKDELKNDPDIKSIEDDEERKKAIEKEVMRQFPSDKQLDKLGETRKEYESGLK